MRDHVEIFKLAHLSAFIPREHEQQLIDPARLNAIASIGNCGTMFVEELPIAIIGFYELWAGVIEVFVIPSVHIPHYAKTFLKSVKRWLHSVERDLEPHRIQTASLADDKTDRWMTWLGFEQEGTLKRYSVNQDDYRMWARLAR